MKDRQKPAREKSRADQGLSLFATSAGRTASRRTHRHQRTSTCPSGSGGKPSRTERYPWRRAAAPFGATLSLLLRKEALERAWEMPIMEDAVGRQVQAPRGSLNAPRRNDPASANWRGRCSLWACGPRLLLIRSALPGALW